MDSTLRTHAASDVGRKRARNEDCHAIHAPSDPAVRASRGTLLVVADGLGGAPAGDVASRMAVEAVVRCFEQSSSDDLLACLRESLLAANREVHEAGLRRAEWLGMGTTCTAALVRGRELWLAHVGDSRAYLVREGRALQLTEDHSLVTALVPHELSGQEMLPRAARHAITRCVGAHEVAEVDAERAPFTLELGDTLVLCSDGLYGQVADREIVALVTNPSLDRACRDLVDLANRRGGPDNITVVVARVESLGIEEVHARLADLEGEDRRERSRSWWRFWQRRSDRTR